MDADIKALEREVAKINPPPIPSHLLGPPGPLGPPQSASHIQQSTLTSYGATHSSSQRHTAQFHPYNQQASLASTTSAAAAILQQQMAARSAIAQAAQLQARAAAITAARTRTLMSAAAQARAAAARAHNPNVVSGAPSQHRSSRDPTHLQSDDASTASVGPSYTKNVIVTNKYGKGGSGGYRANNYKRYEYSYDRNRNAAPNSSLRNHRMHDMNSMMLPDEAAALGKPAKKKKLKATHQYQLRTAAEEKWVDPTMTEWPENDFRIFCGDLGNEVSDAMLTSAFSKYPSFAKAKVVRDKRTGKSKGYGFVSFLEPNDFIRAFKEMNGKYVGNRPIKLRRSKWKDRMKKVKNFKIRE